MFSVLVLAIFLSALAMSFASFEDEPDKQFVECQTTKGKFVLEIHPSWSPLGAERFLELVKDGFFTDIALYRCVSGFLTQFGISDKPEYQHWHNKNIMDDPNLHLGIKKHYLSFAGGGADTRSTQLFISFEDLDFLGKSPWETPFGKVVEGNAVVDSFYTGYGDIAPFNKHGPNQQVLYQQGNSYIHNNFPKIDFIETCRVIE